jgi:hypothetical protein
LENLPSGFDGVRYQWVDLDGDGLSGLLSEQAGGWYYKRNLSPLAPDPGAGPPDDRQGKPVRIGPLEKVREKPAADLARLLTKLPDGNSGSKARNYIPQISIIIHSVTSGTKSKKSGVILAR